MTIFNKNIYSKKTKIFVTQLNEKLNTQLTNISIIPKFKKITKEKCLMIIPVPCPTQNENDIEILTQNPLENPLEKEENNDVTEVNCPIILSSVEKISEYQKTLPIDDKLKNVLEKKYPKERKFGFIIFQVFSSSEEKEYKIRYKFLMKHPDVLFVPTLHIHSSEIIPEYANFSHVICAYNAVLNKYNQGKIPRNSTSINYLNNEKYFYFSITNYLGKNKNEDVLCIDSVLNKFIETINFPSNDENFQTPKSGTKKERICNDEQRYQDFQPNLDGTVSSFSDEIFQRFSNIDFEYRDREMFKNV